MIIFFVQNHNIHISVISCYTLHSIFWFCFFCLSLLFYVQFRYFKTQKDVKFTFNLGSLLNKICFLVANNFKYVSICNNMYTQLANSNLSGEIKSKTIQWSGRERFLLKTGCKI